MEFWNLQSQYGVHRTRSFKKIFPSKEDFYTEYTNIGLGGFTDDDTLNKLYVLLYARHANDAILSSDENRFKYQLFSIIYIRGPEYEKKLEIQRQLRALTEEELSKGTTAIYNFANNPSTLPTSEDFQQLRKINSQTATGYKKSRAESLLIQYEAIESGFIETFLNKFDKLFTPFPAEDPLLYEVKGVEEND